jgi:RNA polymerase sigma factor (sigma-70 family)
MNLPAEYKRKRAFWKDQALSTKQRCFQKVFDEEEWLINYCIKQLHIYKNEEDFYQEGLVGLWEAYERFDESRGVEFRTFAWRTILSKMLTLLAKNSKREDRQATLTDAIVEVIEDVFTTVPFEYETLLLYCDGLTPNQKKWVILHFIEGKGPMEIAEEEGVGIETVKSWRRYALQRIRKNLDILDLG